MKLPFKKSGYMFVKDGYFRMFIRWAYHKYLDELYVPEESSVEETDNTPFRYVLRAYSPDRRRRREYYFK